MFEVDCQANGTVISCLGVNILALFEHFPTSDHLSTATFLNLYKFEFSKIDVVLISDGRSYVLVEALMNIPEFKGFVLTTRQNYRIGRNLITEYRMIDSNNREPLSTDLRIVPLNFHQTYSFKELCFIPTPNGCGIGACNWMITKNVDPELVDFKAFLITGLNTSTIFTQPYSPLNPNSQTTPQPPVPKPPNVICVVPSAISEFDCGECIKALAAAVKESLRVGKKVVIPSYTDDILFFIMHYLRITSALSVDFAHLSYRGQTLSDIVTSFEYTEPISNLVISNKVEISILESCKVFFGPSPNQPIGQIIQAIDILGVRCDVLPAISMKPTPVTLPLNSNYQALARYINEINCPNVIVPQDNSSSQNSFRVKNSKEYPFSMEVNDNIVRWIDLKQMQNSGNKNQNDSENPENENKPRKNKKQDKLEGKDSDKLPIFQGTFSGEYIKINQTNSNFVVSPPCIEQIVYLLADQGAQNIVVDENKIAFECPFVDGDNKGSIIIDGDDITIETGSGFIEDVILEFITKRVQSYY